MKITIRLTPLKLGPFKIPLIVSIAGSVDPPLQTLLSCTCVGPRIVLDQTEVWCAFALYGVSMRPYCSTPAILFLPLIP
jgi:hypothetical protein